MEKTAITHVDLVVSYTVSKEVRKDLFTKLEAAGVFTNAKMITPINYHFHLLGYSEPSKQEALIQNVEKILSDFAARFPNNLFASLCK